MATPTSVAVKAELDDSQKCLADYCPKAPPKPKRTAAKGKAKGSGKRAQQQAAQQLKDRKKDLDKVNYRVTHLAPQEVKDMWALAKKGESAIPKDVLFDSILATEKGDFSAVLDLLRSTQKDLTTGTELPRSKNGRVDSALAADLVRCVSQTSTRNLVLIPTNNNDNNMNNNYNHTPNQKQQQQ